MATVLAIGQVASAQAPVPPAGSSPDALATDLIQTCRAATLAAIQEQTAAYGATLTRDTAGLKAKQVVAALALQRAGGSGAAASQELANINGGAVSYRGATKAYALCLDNRRVAQVDAICNNYEWASAGAELAKKAYEATEGLDDASLAFITGKPDPNQAGARRTHEVWLARVGLTATDAMIARAAQCPDPIAQASNQEFRERFLDECLKRDTADVCARPVAPGEREPLAP